MKRTLEWSVEDEQVSLAHRSVVTIGVFDGLHLGHRMLIEKALNRACELGVQSTVVTFYPSPDILFGKSEPQYLLLPAERASLLHSWGIDVVAVTSFDGYVASLTARAFMERLCTAFHPTEIWVGADFALGRGREGTISLLEKIGLQLGYALRVQEPVMVDGHVVSSTLIRHLLRAGDVATASRCLGRPYSVSGLIVRGEGRGRELGFPTANMSFSREKMLPSNGVYFGRVRYAERDFPALANIGNKPTFGSYPRALEAYLLDFEGQLYGEQITFEFLERLRDELCFSSIEALKMQMNRDLAEAKALLLSPVYHEGHVRGV